MKVTANEVFGIDWTNLEQVKRLCDKLGRGNSVIKRPNVPNYNIIPTENLNDACYKGVQVMYIR